MEEQYDFDAYFLPSMKPPSVEVGSLVAFSVPATAEKGRSPGASFVAELAPLGDAVIKAGHLQKHLGQIYY